MRFPQKTHGSYQTIELRQQLNPFQFAFNLSPGRAINARPLYYIVPYGKISSITAVEFAPFLHWWLGFSIW